MERLETEVPTHDKKDTETEDVVGRIWTGFVPIRETLGEPGFQVKGKVAGGDRACDGLCGKVE